MTTPMTDTSEPQALGAELILTAEAEVIPGPAPDEEDEQ